MTKLAISKEPTLKSGSGEPSKDTVQSQRDQMPPSTNLNQMLSDTCAQLVARIKPRDSPKTKFALEPGVGRSGSKQELAGLGPDTACYFINLFPAACPSYLVFLHHDLHCLILKNHIMLAEEGP